MVRRYTDAYGYHTHTRSQLEVSTNFSLGGATNSNMRTWDSHKAFRARPKNGKVVNGFKMPTSWSMYAEKTWEQPTDYRYTLNNIRYRIRSDGFYAHGHGNSYANKHFSVTSTNTSATQSGKVTNFPVSLSNQAKTKARLKLSDGEINLGVAMAESKQTFSFLVDSVSRLAFLLNLARRRRWSQLARATGWHLLHGRGKQAAHSWLAYQYAILPLMNDIYGAHVVLTEGLKTKEQLFSVSSTATSSRGLIRGTDYSIMTLDSDSSGRRGTRRCGGKVTYTYRCKYYQKMSNVGIAQLTQLGLTNPLLVAWELVPFSFVIDWLLPIGDVLDAMTATLGHTFVAGFEDYIVTTDIDYTVNLGILTAGKPAKHRRSSKAFERRVVSTWGTPALWVKNPFSTTRAANAIALVRALKR